MKAVRLVVCFALCTLAAACGSSTTSTSTDDVVSADQDASADTLTGDAATDLDTVSADVPLTDTTSYKHATCAAVTDCAQAACAGSTASNCASACLADGAPAALPTATALLSCIQTKCILGQCKDSTAPSCLADCSSLRCMPAIFDCIEDGKTGTGTCGDVKTCFDTCNAGKTSVMSCLSTCYEKISAEGKAKGKVFANCVASAPGTSDPTAACMKETLSCFVDGKTGTKGCYESMPCLAGCDKASDPFACALACMSTMTKSAQDAYADVAPCLGQDITATAGCEDKLVVCLAPTGTQTCADALGCVMGCDGNGSSNDPTCMFTCLHNTTADADKLLLSKLGCDPSDPTCASGIIECLAPKGTETCASVVSCATSCSAGQGQSPDMKCVVACIQKGSVASATAAYGAMNCMGKGGVGCDTKMVACYNPSGTGNCAQTTTCVQNCYSAGGDIGGCQTGCYGKASTQGFTDFLAWSTCQQKCSQTCNGDQTCTNTCTNSQCPTAKGACQPT